MVLPWDGLTGMEIPRAQYRMNDCRMGHYRSGWRLSDPSDFLVGIPDSATSTVVFQEGNLRWVLAAEGLFWSGGSLSLRSAFPLCFRAQCIFQFSDLPHADLAPCGGCRAVEGGFPCLTIAVETTPTMVGSSPQPTAYRPSPRGPCARYGVVA